ncbi:hypothetical protein IFM89_014668 [Coptis chinensis]|uniref:peptidyl-tRNA hydrolase n=1 Tax=Coptis chinensis TaxID=261450 RepID=A0A835HMB7_9MAGN|nr:hypothetical protein IFM89_014668 [Coptis chinensis]
MNNVLLLKGVVLYYRLLFSFLLHRAPKALNRWEMCGQVKVVLKSESEDDLLVLQERAKSLNLPTHITIDAGRTQIAPNSRTVMALLGKQVGWTKGGVAAFLFFECFLICKDWWWKDLGLGSHPKLSFARDRLMECFFWTTGVIGDPRFYYCRKWYIKLNTMVTTIDDVYDVYGTLDELTLLRGWAYFILKEQGWDAIPYLKQSWTDLCKSYLVEAKWYYNKYTPTFGEYLSNACISISGTLLLVHIYFFIEQDITKEALECLGSCPNVIRSSSMILRLSDDLGTSKAALERGDVPKSIQCYMHETGVLEEVACEYIRHMIGNLWKKMNKDRLDDSFFSQTYIEAVVNLARMAQCMYRYRDGHGVPDS